MKLWRPFHKEIKVQTDKRITIPIKVLAESLFEEYNPNKYYYFARVSHNDDIIITQYQK